MCIKQLKTKAERLAALKQVLKRYKTLSELEHPRRRKILSKYKVIRECLGCGSKPKLKYREDEINHPNGSYINFSFQFHCPECGYKAGCFQDFVPAFSSWHTSNTPNDAHYAACWASEYEKQLLNKENK